MTQVIEGTTEEIMAQLQRTFPSQKLRVFVETEEDPSTELPNPPNTVRDEAHLVSLLRDGLNSPVQEVTEETWEQKRDEVRRRHAARQQ